MLSRNSYYVFSSGKKIKTFISSAKIYVFSKLEFFKLNFALVLPILLEATSLHRRDFFSQISKVIYVPNIITKVQLSSLFLCFSNLLGKPSIFD